MGRWTPFSGWDNIKLLTISIFGNLLVTSHIIHFTINQRISSPIILCTPNSFRRMRASSASSSLLGCSEELVRGCVTSQRETLSTGTWQLGTCWSTPTWSAKCLTLACLDSWGAWTTTSLHTLPHWYVSVNWASVFLKTLLSFDSKSVTLIHWFTACLPSSGQQDSCEVDGTRSLSASQVQLSQWCMELWHTYVGSDVIWRASILGHEQSRGEYVGECSLSTGSHKTHKFNISSVIIYH